MKKFGRIAVGVTGVLVVVESVVTLLGVFGVPGIDATLWLGRATIGAILFLAGLSVSCFG